MYIRSRALQRAGQREQAERRVGCPALRRACLGQHRRQLSRWRARQQLAQLIRQRENLTAPWASNGKCPKQQPTLDQRLRRAGVVTVEQKASDLAVARPRVTQGFLFVAGQ